MSAPVHQCDRLPSQFLNSWRGGMHRFGLSPYFADASSPPDPTRSICSHVGFVFGGPTPTKAWEWGRAGIAQRRGSVRRANSALEQPLQIDSAITLEDSRAGIGLNAASAPELRQEPVEAAVRLGD